MKKIILLPFLLATILLLAQDKQDDLVFTVKKKKALTIEPDNMNLEVGSPSQYTIKGIPAGYSVRGSFDDARLRINADGTFTLQPENKSGNRPYLADLQISIYNSEGDAMILKRTCYVSPKSVRPQMSAQQISSLISAQKGSEWDRIMAARRIAAKRNIRIY